ncbi:MAG: AsmA family protein [Desulfovibrionaceae bacterium]
MSKGLKYSLIGVGVLAGLTVLAVVLILALVDPNDYKDDIASAVRDKTGRTLAFEGDLSLSLFPWIGLETGGLSLSNAPGFGDEPFAAMDRSKLKVKLLPLLSSELEVGRVVLEGLVLNLARNEQGETNWADLSQTSEAPASAEEQQNASRGEGGPVKLAVDGLEIKNARISWQDMQAGKTYLIKNMDLSTGKIAPDHPFDLKLSMAMASSEPDVEFDLNLSGEVLARFAERIYQIQGLELDLAAKGAALKGGEARLQFAGDLFADEVNKVYHFREITADLTAAGGLVPDKGVTASLSADADADLKAQTATVSGLALTLMDLKATGGVQASSILDKPKADIDLTVAPFDAKKLLADLGQPAIETSDPDALRKVALQTVIEYGPAAIRAKDLKLTLDETTASGSLGLKNPDKPSYQAELKVDAINLDRYLPPPSDEQAAPKAEKEQKQGEKKEGLPLEPLRDLRADAVIDVGRLVLKKLTFTDMHVEVHAKDGLVKVKPAKLAGYGGALVSSLVMDVRKKVPAANMDLSLAGLDLAPMLTDLTGKPEAQGIVDLSANLATKGETRRTMLEHLNGKADFKMKDGEIADFNPVLILRNALSVLRGGGRSSQAPTDMADVSGSAVIKKGVVYNQDLSARSPLFRANGEGAVDLVREKIGYVLDTSLVATTEGQEGADVEDLIGVTVPISISGDLADPSVGVDLKKMARALLESGVRDVGGILKGTGEGLDEGLKDLGDQLMGGSPKDSEGQQEKKRIKPQDLIKGLFQ